uniref:Receptor expression-enhancing protein n=1 Tax=Equus asinus TaxID=9793 RepID=A0A9L0JQ33_EQUAS
VSLTGLSVPRTPVSCPFPTRQEAPRGQGTGLLCSPLSPQCSAQAGHTDARFPFYYELKIAFVAWLLSPYTKGSSLLYRKFVHPTLSSKEKEIDDCLVQAKDRSYDALVHYGKRGLNVAATAAVMAASKGQGALSERLRSFSMQDLSTIRGDGAPAPSGPPPPGSGRASGKHGQPKMSRSASESAGSSGTA